MKLVITENLVQRTGGAFKLSTLLQKRLRELVKGAPRLTQTGEDVGDFEASLKEVNQGLVVLESQAEEPEENTKDKKKK